MLAHLFKAICLVSAVYALPTTKPFIPHVIRCPVATELNMEALMHQTELDIWSHEVAIGGTVDVYVRKSNEVEIVEKALNVVASDKCSIMIKDVQKIVKTQQSGIKSGRKIVWTREMDVEDYFNDYQPYTSMVEFLKVLAEKYPQLVTLIDSIGTSVEGRKIPVLKITNSTAVGPKRAIFWNGGQHAREWVSPSTVLYLAHQLLTQKTDQVQQWLQLVDFYIIPIQNPDGYHYTHVKNRMWRKNRQKNKNGSFGVDLNRNWDEHFGVIGTSNNPSDETYRGSAPFSEPETKAVSQFILSISNRYAGIDFHSYSQLILRNWGWTFSLSKNEKILKEIGDKMADAIQKTHQEEYTSETGADLYRASGCADDWMAAKASMVSYTIELRDTGNYGFLLPADEILPVGEEIWNAMKVFVDLTLTKNIPPNSYTTV